MTGPSSSPGSPPIPPRVSGILPVHNEAAVLREVLDSIARQTRPVDELVVVLDRCTDGSRDIVRGRCDRLVEVDEGNTARAVMAGIGRASSETLVLFDGNTAVPEEFVEGLLRSLDATKADLVEWHGGMMALTKSTLARFGPFSALHLWTLEYFERIRTNQGIVVHLHGPFRRLKPSPLGRNLRYGLDYAELCARYDMPPFFRIGTKSGWLPDAFAAIGVVAGHARRGTLLSSLRRIPGYVREPRPERRNQST